MDLFVEVAFIVGFILLIISTTLLIKDIIAWSKEEV